ncbi:YraN family protein [Halanaerobacter jeridensis]|uniref:UPF0102 protein JOC47_000149 n=1 Tax=Halanaerobacter jeridensis TaxID=706427 RepID=A0A938XQ97_9FIRM|nr:YraN family protein [Halanaerobacter jeridensis]MBM7555325.1 putative endonuclease [Halanaerobacter jeridensis]
MNNREIGRQGEQLAQNFLEQHDYIILEKNFCCRYGEIDLIAQVNNYLSFIEVKFCSDQSFMPLEYKIDKFKQEKIKRTAQYYLKFRNVPFDFRFDVVLINEEEAKPEIKLIQNAFWTKERV